MPGGENAWWLNECLAWMFGGIWHLAYELSGIWHLAFGIWHLAFGIWHMNWVPGGIWFELNAYNFYMWVDVYTVYIVLFEEYASRSPVLWNYAFAMVTFVDAIQFQDVSISGESGHAGNIGNNSWGKRGQVFEEKTNIEVKFWGQIVNYWEQLGHFDVQIENILGTEYFENILGTEYFENILGTEYFGNILMNKYF